MTVKRTRMVAFLIAASWILLLPGWMQYGVGRPDFVEVWNMDANLGVGVCDVRFYAQSEQGERYVPRLATLHPNVSINNISDSERQVAASEIPEIGKELCAKTGAVDLRAHARCATVDGWETGVSPEMNLCLHPLASTDQGVQLH